MWRWLRDNKDALSAVATILQAVAVVAGVLFAVNEFVLKDRQASRNRIDAAFKIFRSGAGLDTQLSLGDLFFQVVGNADEEALKQRLHREEEELYTATVKAIHRYTEIRACLKTQNCDEEIIRHLFCADAFFDAFVAYKIIIRPPKWTRPNYDHRLDNLFDFFLSCVQGSDPGFKNIRWNERRGENWDPILGPIFSKIDEKWREAVDAARESERSSGSDEGTAR